MGRTKCNLNDVHIAWLTDRDILLGDTARQFGIYSAQQNHGGSDVVWLDLLTSDLQESSTRDFRWQHNRSSWTHLPSDNRRDIDDIAGPLLLHVRGCCTDAMRNTFDIEVNRPRPLSRSYLKGYQQGRPRTGAWAWEKCRGGYQRSEQVDRATATTSVDHGMTYARLSGRKLASVRQHWGRPLPFFTPHDHTVS